jgi:hypothetical protein
MKTKNVLLLSAVLFSTGCPTNPPTPTDGGGGGDAGTTMDMVVVSMPDMLPPPPPTPGAQIDRIGRPTINVAATNPFDLMQGKGDRDATREAYNADSDPTMWQANWVGSLKANLAIYDGADTACGSQAFACGMAGGCMMGYTPDTTTYAALAGVLADDRLYVDTTKTTCGYLGAEGLGTCGGRLPTKAEDIIDITYTVLTVGISGLGTLPVKDGVTNGEADPSLTTFPFLSAPN